jgi:uncharacterized membrane protein SirB2
MAFKHIHMTLALITLLGFLMRSTWAFMGSNLLEKKFVKIAPHIIDTLFLLSAIALMVLMQQYPFVHAWLTGKIIGLVAYIVFGVFTLKRAKNNSQRAVFFLLALGAFFYTAKVAMTKNALFFL